ncbi:MarR family winged helix-turn-helix transcriptional regulator [Clostridium magnum]|uniref:Transcriptional regulator SlyA n=1 Tax=Clostridium magnum DSM 2767 TaxID=1121326 RepID=A0A162R9Q3_9CLOT|nr:MarR family transcriptional regulator [Clostridium magnum]KZL89600.1 transcriptional regulator SlyA [Clostridium magnum DSM 2767]SHH73764.1 DNA-binding transcriptional regulator, MarR family [Clostridium magnum DSM 2767]
MSTTELNKLSGDLYSLMLYLHRKFFNPSEITKNLPIPPSHIKVIIHLAHHGACSISEAAKNLTISKPNMTPIIDKLISEGMVTRYNDPNDRRILRIELTEKAHEFIKEQEEAIKNNLAQKISSLDSKDLEALNTHVRGITDIILKVD